MQQGLQLVLVGEHFTECEQAQYLANLQDQYTKLNDLILATKELRRSYAY